MALHGWLIIDKPVGPGSTQIVSAVKRALRTGGYGKYKVGHGGTLDPLASGVLPVAIMTSEGNGTPPQPSVKPSVSVETMPMR